MFVRFISFRTFFSSSLRLSWNLDLFSILSVFLYFYHSITPSFVSCRNSAFFFVVRPCLLLFYLHINEIEWPKLYNIYLINCNNLFTTKWMPVGYSSGIEVMWQAKQSNAKRIQWNHTIECQFYSMANFKISVDHFICSCLFFSFCFLHVFFGHFFFVSFLLKHFNHTHTWHPRIYSHTFLLFAIRWSFLSSQNIYFLHIY